MIFPSYLQPPSDVVSNCSWTITVGGRPVTGKVVEGWDYSTPIRVTFRCEIDLTALLGALSLGADARIALVLRWRATGTGLRGASEQRPVENSNTEVSLGLDSSVLGGALLLNAAMILTSAGPTPGPLAPTRPGSILWSEARKLELEGEGERFPVELISFRKAGIRGQRGAWSLRWDSDDLEQAVGSCLRIQMNGDNARSRAAALDPGNARNAEFMNVLRWDVTRQMINAALFDEERFRTLDWPERSLGSALAARIQTAFPNMTLEECRTLRRTRPQDFETSLHTATGLFE